MNAYKIQREEEQRKINEFLSQYAFFAFDAGQFKEGLNRLQAKEKDVIRISGGGFILKDRAEELSNMLQNFRKAREKAIADPDTGKDFARDMFLYELVNHEYTYTGDPEEAVNALGYTRKDINHNAVLKSALQEAINILIES